MFGNAITAILLNIGEVAAVPTAIEATPAPRRGGQTMVICASSLPQQMAMVFTFFAPLLPDLALSSVRSNIWL